MDAKAPALVPDIDALPLLSLTEISGLIRTGVVSPVEVTQSILARIARYDGALKSFITVTEEHALKAAKQAEGEIAAGYWRGPLHGVPIAVKDLCNTTYAPTSHGMFINKDFMAEENATVVQRIDNAGGIMVGKLAQTEGAMSGHHPKMPTPVNPWFAGAWTGASSSGSGVATAAGFCYAALGSDTGGSIRLPSTANGLSGVKPTWGRVSRAGVWALADSLDHVGPMTRTAADAAAVLGVIAGADARDPTTLSAPVPDYLGSLGGSIAGLRIGLDETYVFSDLDPEVAAMMRATIASFVELGARIVPVKFPSIEGMGDYWMKICAAECAVAHKATYPSRKDEYGPVLAGIIETGIKTTSLELAEAMQWRLKFNGAVATTMSDCDLLLVPAIPTIVHPAEIWASPDNAKEIGGAVRFTAGFDFTGQPTLSLNGGFDSRGVPLGFQLVGPHLGEALMLKAGHAFQSITPWHTRHPQLS
ncbi:MAG: amidase [Pelagibacterium sp. SCN 63-23]|nr:MAG: amidase [Pelagibacterium sp. SCN 63-23]